MRGSFVAVTVAAFLSATAGCGGGSAAGPAEGTKALTTVATAKPVAAIDVTLSVHPVPLSADREFSVHMTATSHDTVPSARADISASGTASLVGDHGATWKGLTPGVTRETETKARVHGQGHGEIHGTVVADGPHTGIGSGRTAVLYVLAADDEVLVGVDGPTTLELTHLDHQLAKGRITSEEFEQARDKVISGG